jgi:NIPSNAP
MTIYLQQDFDLHPASPATRDRFVALATESIAPGWARLGARLVGAWFPHESWFSQITHVIEFADLAAFDASRRRARDDAAWCAASLEIEQLAPRRSETLLEPLGPVAPAALDAAIETARSEPVGAHTFAILEVAPGAMERFTKLLAFAKDQLPIVASWRAVAGNPDLVIDLWKGDLGRAGYQPTDARTDAFFGPLREVAPRERLVRLLPLPYSPLR